MPEPAISIIIPTFNRTRELGFCLAGFAYQQYVSNQDFEILIIDDGSTDDMGSVVNPFQSVMSVRLLRTDHCGAGVARNVGLQSARGALILLYDDDAQPTPDLVRYCLEFHRKYPEERDMALLSFEAESTLESSPFEQWAFPRIYPFPAQAGVYNWKYFWTCSLTLKKSAFRHGEFDPAFQMTEDTELGLRLEDALGIRIYYHPRSFGTFLRRLNLRQICRRQYTIAYFTYRVVEKHQRPEDFAWAPFVEPEKYVVEDKERLAQMACIVSAFDQSGCAGGTKVVTRIITELFLQIEMHCAAKGWMAARDGLPLDPVTCLAPLLNSPR